MTLQKNRTGTVRAHLRETDVLGRSDDCGVVLYEHSVLYNGYTGERTVCSVFLEHRSRVDDVIHVPLSRLAHGVHERCGLLVDTSSLTVDISAVVVAVEHLKLIHTLQIDTAVAACLSLTVDVLRYAPLYVELEVVELLLGADVALALVHGHHAVGYSPFGRTALRVLPCREVAAVKQHDGIRRSCEAASLQICARCDNRSDRSVELRHFRAHAFLGTRAACRGKHQSRRA